MKVRDIKNEFGINWNTTFSLADKFDTFQYLIDNAISEHYKENNLIHVLDINSFYIVANELSEDYDIITNTGLKLNVMPDARGFVTPEQFGADGINDTLAVQACIDSFKPVQLKRYYEVTSIQLPLERSGITIYGGGASTTGLRGTDDNSEYIFQTWNSENLKYQGSHDMRNFGIIGRGKRAFVVAQTINSNFEMIHMISGGNYVGNPNSFIGDVSLVVEESFGNTFRNIQTSSIATGQSDIKINSTVLDTEFDLLYTNHATALYNLDINCFRREIPTNLNNAGFGRIVFNTPTIQGARRYGIKVIANEGAVVFNNAYYENIVGAAFIAGINVTFNDTNFDVAVNSGDHSIWIDEHRTVVSNGIRFNNCGFRNDKPIVIGNARDIAFDTDVYDLIERTNGATQLLNPYDTRRTQVNIQGDNLDIFGSVIGLKCVGIGGLHTRITVDETGALSGGTPFLFPATILAPHSVCVNMGGSSVIARTVNVDSVNYTARGLGGNAPITFTLTGTFPTGIVVESTTGVVSGIPTETGVFNFNVTGTDGTEKDVSKTVKLTVID